MLRRKSLKIRSNQFIRGSSKSQGPAAFRRLASVLTQVDSMLGRIMSPSKIRARCRGVPHTGFRSSETSASILEQVHVEALQE